MSADTLLPVWRDRILAVGSNAEIERLASPQTQRLDLHGRRVLPGRADLNTLTSTSETGICPNQVYMPQNYGPPR